jgi:hypothetical protein
LWLNFAIDGQIHIAASGLADIHIIGFSITPGLGLIGVLGLVSEYREYTLRKSSEIAKSTSYMEQGDGQFVTGHVPQAEKLPSSKVSDSSFEQ